MVLVDSESSVFSSAGIEKCREEDDHTSPQFLKRQMSAMTEVMAQCSLQNPSTCLNMNGLLVLDGSIDEREFIGLLQVRVGRFARFRSIPEFRTGFMGRKFLSWKDLGDKYEARHNVISVDALKWGSTGADFEVESYINGVLSTPFREGIPAWEMHLIHNLPQGKTGLFAKFDHSTGDGFTMVQILLSLTEEFNDDLLMNEATSLQKGARLKNELPDNSLDKQNKNNNNTVSDQLKAIASFLFWCCMKTMFFVWYVPLAVYVTCIKAFLQDTKTPICPYGATKGRRSVHFSRAFPIQQIKEAGKRNGKAKVNDVVLSVVLSAALKYLKAECNVKINKKFRATAGCTMNYRRDCELLDKISETQLGNRSGFIFLPVPNPSICCISTASALQQIQGMTSKLKVSPLFLLAGLVHQISKWSSALLGQQKLVDLMSSKRYSELWKTTLLTNVPGPRHPKCLLGQRVLEVRAFINGPNVTCAFSYDGVLRIGYTADDEVVDGGKMIEYMHKAFDELLQSSGMA